MIRPAIQALLSALFVVSAPFVVAFGIEGFYILFGVPSYKAPDLPRSQRELMAAASFVIGLLLASCFWSTAPQLRTPFKALTGAGLLAVLILFVLVY